MNSTTLSGYIKRIPGIKWFYRSYIKTPGHWIYSAANLEWLTNRGLVNQLPPIYKVFASYCRLQLVTFGRVFGAETLLHLIFFVSNRCGVTRHVCLKISDSESIFLNLRDPRFLVIPRELSNDNTLPSMLSKFLKAGDTFVDVGANHGTFSVKASHIVGPTGYVVSIEPQPEMSDLIKRSLEMNRASPFIVLPIACGNKNGTLEFFIPRASSGSAGLHPRFSAISSCIKINVTVKKFDEAIDWSNFSGSTFVKLDVEGSELAFLEGADKMLRSVTPLILMEINPSTIQASGTSLKEIVERLISIGYREYCAADNLGETCSLQKLDGLVYQNIIVGNDICLKMAVEL